MTRCKTDPDEWDNDGCDCNVSETSARTYVTLSTLMDKVCDITELRSANEKAIYGVHTVD